MYKPKVYFETTMFSFYYEERNRPGYLILKEQTRKVFDILKIGRYNAYSSSITISELLKDPNQKKSEKMILLLSEFNIILLEETEQARELTEIYLKEKVVPASEPIDALHIAIATVNGLDYIVSLNFEHLVRPWTIEHVRRINLREGYKPIGLYKPEEVLQL
jgi:predicted nucleic acid-binding protein